MYACDASLRGAVMREVAKWESASQQNAINILCHFLIRKQGDWLLCSFLTLQPTLHMSISQRSLTLIKIIYWIKACTYIPGSGYTLVLLHSSYSISIYTIM